MNWDFVMDKIRKADRPIRVLKPVRPYRRRYGGLRQGRRHPSAMWTRPRAWWPGPRTMPGSPASPDAPIRWIVDDCAKFVERRSAGARPMTRSLWTRPATAGVPAVRSGSWRRACTPFVKLCAGVLSDKPLFVLINSYTTGLAPSVLGYLLHLLVAENTAAPSAGTSWVCR